MVLPLAGNMREAFLMKAELIEKAYAVAKDRYAAIGVNTDKVLDQLQ